jgi:hypothetical protein
VSSRVLETWGCYSGFADIVMRMPCRLPELKSTLRNSNQLYLKTLLYSLV